LNEPTGNSLKIMENHQRLMAGMAGMAGFIDLICFNDHHSIFSSTPEAGMQTPQIGSSPISDSRTPPGMENYHVTKHR